MLQAKRSLSGQCKSKLIEALVAPIPRPANSAPIVQQVIVCTQPAALLLKIFSRDRPPVRCNHMQKVSGSILPVRRSKRLQHPRRASN